MLNEIIKKISKRQRTNNEINRWNLTWISSVYKFFSSFRSSVEGRSAHACLDYTNRKLWRHKSLFFPRCGGIWKLKILNNYHSLSHVLHIWGFLIVLGGFWSDLLFCRKQKSHPSSQTLLDSLSVTSTFHCMSSQANSSLAFCPFLGLRDEKLLAVRGDWEKTMPWTMHTIKKEKLICNFNSHFSSYNFIHFSFFSVAINIFFSGSPELSDTCESESGC